MSSSQVRRLGATCGVTVAAGLLLTATAVPASATEVSEPSEFTSAFTVMATGDTIIDTEGVAVPGDDDATGTFDYRINSDDEIICYDIRLEGVTPPYESPAKTATHLHAAPEGQGGPPRLSFPDPEGEGDVLTSSGCMQGPFTTGLEGDDGVDTGEGFSLAEIEADPASFSSDTHTSEFVAGAVRGQLVEVPVGGVAAGGGGTADEVVGAGTGSTTAAVTALGLVGVGAVGAVAYRRRTARGDV